MSRNISLAVVTSELGTRCLAEYWCHSLICGVPREGYCFLTGESPRHGKSQSHVAWMAGGGGNVAF